MNNITGSSSDSDVSKRDVSAVPITNATTNDIIIKAQYIDIQLEEMVVMVCKSQLE